MTSVLETPPATVLGATVAIVEDHRLLAETLAASLRGRGVVARPMDLDGDGELCRSIVELEPDLVLLDLDLGDGRSAVELTTRLAGHGVPVLLVTGSEDRVAIAAVLESGAVSWVSKACGFDALVDATTTALGGLRPDHSDLLVELAAARRQADIDGGPFDSLTERERDTLHGLREGRSVAELARDWVVSEATVRTHVRGVLCKLRVSSQLAAVAAARRAGWEFTPTVSGG